VSSPSSSPIEGRRPKPNLDGNGINEFGVAMCECKPFGPIHAWEPGEWCSPERVIPPRPNPAGDRETFRALCDRLAATKKGGGQ
jgi:hypothetical protein